MRARPVLRRVLAIAALALAATALVDLARLASAREELVRTARALELTDEGLLRTLRREDDLERARTALARTLLVTGLAEAEPEGRTRRLAESDRIARDVLARRPGSWEAATIAGASTFLLWSLERDPRLLQEYPAWEQPLLLARRLAPGKPEPERYLATAYLELWPALSEAKRELARELLATAFRDRATFERLVDPWLAAAGTDLGPVPPEPWAWEELARALGRRGDWAGYCGAWRMHRRLLESSLRQRLLNALDLVERERLVAARLELFDLAADAPRDRRFAPVVDAALRAAPFGPAPEAATGHLLEWLRWAREGSVRGPLPLSPDAVARLRGAVTARPPVPPATVALAAWAAAAVGDLQRAERLERGVEARWHEEWSPYRIAKARLLIDRRRLEEAAHALDLVHPQRDGVPPYLRARIDLAAAQGRPEEAALLEAQLEALAAAAWPATAWTWRDGVARLELLVAAPAPGVRLGWLEAPETGGAAEVQWDGEAAACLAVGSAPEHVVELPVTAGPHLLEVRSLAGGPTRPGAVAIR